MRIVRSLEQPGLLIKGVIEIIKNESKEQKGGFLRMSSGTLGTSLLRNLLASKCTILMPPHLLTNFEIQKYYEPRFNGVYSRNNLPKIKDGTYEINLGEFESIATHWIALYVNGNNIIYFGAFEIKHILKAF